MKRKRAAIFFFALFLFTLLPNHEAYSVRLEAYKLRNTMITPYLIRRILEDKNMLYCSTFQVAWNKMTDEVTKGTVSLDGSPITEQMLNRRLTGAQDISEDCYLAAAGVARDNIVERVERDMRDKFNEAPGTEMNLKNPHDILIYSFFYKDIAFAEELERLDKPIMFNGANPVKAFGIKEFALDESHIRAAEQVEILYYRNDNEFIVRLLSTQQNDEIILAKFAPLKTLSSSVAFVFSQIATSRPTTLKEKETLQIPMIDFDIVDWFIEIEGRCLQIRGMEDYCIAKAIQSLKFKLVQKASPYELLPSVAEDKSLVKPRKFIFDKPFLICLRQQGVSYPYFVLWVQNTEMLLPAN